TGFTAQGPVSAKTTYIVGDGQNFGANVSFTGSLGTATFNNSMDGSDGNFWDTDTHDVSAQVGAGSISASVSVTDTGDCLMCVAQVFSVTTDAPCAGLVASDSNSRAALFNPATNTLGSIIGIPNHSFVGDTAITPDGKLGFVTNFNSQVWVIDMT